jgi:membrane peptidoglycan carboxypeptidase
MSSTTQLIRRRRARRQRAQDSRAATRWRVGLGVAVTTAALLLPLLALAGVAAWSYFGALPSIPRPADTLYVDPMIGATELYARDENTLILRVQDPLGDQRTWTDVDDLPPFVAAATLAMEDADFMATQADGVGTFLALSNNFLAAAVGDATPSLGTSLTHTLMQNVVFVPRATWQDRARAIATVSAINQQYTPKQVLEWHLNTAFYGYEAYGIAAAARVYLNKPAEQLTIGEAALLAAIPPATQYNPIDNPTAAFSRRNDLLRTLASSGSISTTALDAAVNAPIQINADVAQQARLAATFAEYARRQAKAILDDLGLDGGRLVARGGLRIITTLDVDLQQQAECTLNAHLTRLNGGAAVSVTTADGQPCAAAAYLPQLIPTPLREVSGGLPDSGTLVLLDPNTGAIMALVGDAVDGQHAPGGTLQPFVYFRAFQTLVYNPASMVLDVPRQLPSSTEGLIFVPNNPDGEFRGPLNLRDAFAANLLPPSATLAQAQNMNTVLAIAHRLGINTLTEDNYDAALLARGGAVSPLDLAYAYSTFATQGRMAGVPTAALNTNFRVRNPVAVLRIEDAEGDVLWQYQPNPLPIYDAPIGYLINDILADSDARRRTLNTEDAALRLSGRPAAVVNAQTRGAGGVGATRDLWTVGYTPQWVGAVHLARADGGDMVLDPFGMNGAAAVWRAVMDYAHIRDNLPAQAWPQPDGIRTLSVCERSGQLPNGICPTRAEVFIAGGQPTQEDRFWQSVTINSSNNLLATANTPPGLRSARVYFIPPADAAEWWAANNQPLPPTQYDTVSAPILLTSATILRPQPLEYVGGVVDIRGSMNATQMQFYQLSYGRGVDPSEWLQIGDTRNDYVAGGVLGAWDTTGLDGAYTLRLTVTLLDNTVENSLVTVTVDNQAPSVTLNVTNAPVGVATPAPGQPLVFRFPGDPLISLSADVVDNLSIGRVEFYVDGALVSTDSEWPYTFDYPIERTGLLAFTAVAFDKVNNNTAADIPITVMRGG